MENAFGWQARERSIPDNTWHDMTWHDMTLHTHIYIYLDLRKDTNDCPFARFLPLGRISCKGAGNGHFLTTVVKFWISYLLGWYYSTLRKNVSIFLGGNSREKGGHTREKGGNTRADSSWLKKWKHEVVSVFVEMVIFILKCTNLQKMDRNQTKICPGKKICNQWISRYIIIDWGLC